MKRKRNKAGGPPKASRKSFRVLRTARALALAGLLLSGAPVTSHALELNLNPIWNVVDSLVGILVPEVVTLTGKTGAFNVVSTTGNYLLGGIGSLTVTGTGQSGAVLNVNSNLLTTDGLLSDGMVTVGGNSPSNKGVINVGLGNTLTAGGATNINNFGLIDVTGSLMAQVGLNINSGGQLTLRQGSHLQVGAGSNAVLNGGTLLFSGPDGLSVGNGVLTNNLILLKNGTLLADKLSLAGYTSSADIVANGGALNVNVNLLDLAGVQLNIGNASADQSTTMTINGAKDGETIPEFLGGDVIVKGNAATHTLQLGAPGYTGTSNSSYSIALQGGNGVTAAADKAQLKVDYGNFSVNNVTVGSSDGGYAGTVTINNSGKLTATNTLSINGGALQPGKVTFGPTTTGGKANTLKVKNLVVGGPLSFGVLDMATNAGTTIVDTAVGGSLSVGTGGQVNVNNAGSVLEFTGDWTVKQADLSATGTAANGKIWLNNGTLLVDGTLHTNGDLATNVGGNTVVGTTTTMGALDTGANTLTLNAGKATAILGLNGGNLISGTVKVAGTATMGDTLTLGKDGISMAAGSTGQGTVLLQGTGEGKATLNVVGNGVGASVYQLGSLLAGGENLGGASNTTGAVNVDNAALQTGSLSLLGASGNAAALTIGGTGTASVTTGALTVGNATDKGNVSLLNGSTLTAGTLQYDSTNGGIFVDNAGTLNLSGDAAIAGASLIRGTALANGKVTLDNTAVMNVGGALNLTGSGPITVDVTGAAVNAQTLNAGNVGSPVAMNWDGGTLTLYGHAAAAPFLSASQLTLGGGTVQLGGPTLGVGGATLSTKGGVYGGPVNVNGGTLAVNDGVWSLTDTTAGLNVTAANGLNVMNSTLNTAKLAISGSGTANIGTGPGVGKLAVTGTGADSLASATDSVKVHSNGVFQAGYGVVADSSHNLLGTVGRFAVDLGGTLLLDGTGTITTAEYNMLKSNLLGSSLGTLQLNGITISDAATTLAGVIGLNLPSVVVSAVDGDNVTGSTTVKGLTGPGTGNIGITVSGGEFRMVGDAASGFLFSDNNGHDTDFTVNSGALLTFGNAAGTTPTYGVLQGDVTLSGGGLNAVNGEFGAAQVTGTGNVNVSAATLALASLGLTGGGVTVNQGGTLTAAQASVIHDLALDNGTFRTAAGANLNVGGVLSLINNSLLHVGQDLTLTGSMGNAKDSAIEVLGAFTATGLDITGSNLDMTVGGALAVQNLIGDAGSVYDFGSLNASGLTSIDNASTLRVTGALATHGLTVDHGSTVTAKAGADINGALAIGPNAASSMTVQNDLTTVTTATLGNGSSLDVGGVMTATGLTTVDSASTVHVAGNMATGGLIVDRGATVAADADASTGALSVGPNAASSMTVGGRLDSSTVDLNNSSTLDVMGIMVATGAVGLDNSATLNVGNDLTVIGNLTVDKGSALDAKGNATVNGNLSVGPTAMSKMTVANKLDVNGSSTVDHSSLLDVTGDFESVSTSVDNGSILKVGGNADAGSLALGTTAMAQMNVGGTLKTSTATLTNGSSLDVAGTMTSTGAVDVDKGAVLTADTLAMLGVSPATMLTVGQTSSASVNVKTLTVGDGTSHGRATIANGTVTTDVLNNDSATGGILVQSGGVLNVSGDLGLAGQDLVSTTALQTGKISLDGGSLNVGGNLGLTGGGNVGVDMTGGGTPGVVRALSVSARDGASPVGLTWNGGNLVLFGNGTSFADASGLTVSGGSVQLGAADRTVGGTALTTGGGSFGGAVNIGGGALNVIKGEWALTDAASGLNVSTASGLTVEDATLNVAKLTTAGSYTAGPGGTAAVIVGGGTSLGTLSLTGNAGSLTSSANSIDIVNNGLFLAAYDAVANGLALQSNVGLFDVDTGGTLALTGLATISIDDYRALRAALIGGSGLLNLRGTTITGVDENTTLQEVLGTSLPGNVVVAADGDTVNASTTVKGVTTANPGASDIALTVSDGEFRLVGDGTDPNFQLSQNGDKQTDITVGQNGSLALGDPTGSAPTYGTLNGDITLNGELKADNGTFTVGDVTGGSTAKGVTVNDATLNTGALDLSASPNSVVTVNDGALLAGKDSSVQTVNLNHGTLGTTGTADLTIGGPASLVNGSNLTVGGDLTLTGPSLTASDSTVSTGGAFDATGRDIIGSNLNMTVGGALSVANLSGDNASVYNMGTLNASGNVTLDNGSSLQSAGNAAVAGVLSLGPTVAAQMTVGGDLTAGTGVTLDHGSLLNVSGGMTTTGSTVLNLGSTANIGGVFTPGGSVSVQGASVLNTGTLQTNNQTISVGDASGQGGTLTAGTLDTSGGGAVIVDPADGKAFLGVDMLAGGKLEALVEVGQNGIASFGSRDRQLVDTQIASSGASASSTLFVNAPMTLAGSGQLLVGDKYQKAPNVGVWDTNANKDPYALALRGSSLFLADMNKVQPGGSLVAIDAGSASVAPSGASVLIEPTAAVRLTQDSGLKSGTVYTLVSGIGTNGVIQSENGTAVADGQTLQLDGGLMTNNLLINLSGLTYNAGAGALQATTYAPGASGVLPGLDSGFGAVLDGLAATGFDTQHPQSSVRFLSRATDRRYIRDAGESARTIEGAARLSAVGAAYGMTKSVSDAAVAALDSRMGSAFMQRNRGVSVGLNDDELTLNTEDFREGLTVWFLPLFQSENVHGMGAGNFNTGYTGDFGGGALGADYTHVMGENELRYGVAINAGGGTARSKGDFNSAHNDFTFWGVNLYGRWARNAFALNGDVGYTQNDNELRQDLPASMQMERLKADFNSSAISAGLRAEYMLETSIVNIVPHVGARYMNLVVDSHNVKSGGTVFENSRDSLDIWTFPVGVTLDKNWELENGWNLKPAVDVSVIPASGDLKAINRVNVPGVDGGASLNTSVVDDVTFSGSFGIELKKDAISLGLNYNIQASEHRTGNGVFATLSVAF